MNLLNIINSVADSNLAYYLLIVILIIVVIAMIYLIYSQNKEIIEAKKKEVLEDKKEEPVNNDVVEEIAREVKNESLDHASHEPIHESVLELEAGKDNLSNTIHDFALEDDDNGEKVEKIEDIELPRVKKLELLDATMTNVPKVSLLEQTMTSIPPIMDYSNETEELVNISKELEKIPKERTIKLTPYEEEQENTAIISYDELIENKDNIVYENERKEGDLSIKKVDLEKTPEVDTVHPENYAHEEVFLRRLKELQSKLD